MSLVCLLVKICVYLILLTSIFLSNNAHLKPNQGCHSLRDFSICRKSQGKLGNFKITESIRKTQVSFRFKKSQENFF